MRKLFAKKFKDEKEINARKLFEEEEEEPVDTTRGWTQEIERRKLKWWERLLYQKEVRMVGLWLFCIGFVIGVPLILEHYDIAETIPDKEFGTCRVREGFWIDCLPDELNHTKVACETRQCCWVVDDVNNGSCFHRLPSPYSLRIVSASGGIITGRASGIGLLDNQKVELYFRASSSRNGHVLFETSEDGEPVPLQPTSSTDPIAEELLQKVDDMLIVNIRLRDYSGAESLARSHFGPTMQSKDLTEISFYLGGPVVFARDMTNFLWTEETEEQQMSYFNYGRESSLHLPAVLGLHPSGMWYAMVLETSRPGLQIVQRGREGRPILTWRVMGGNLKIHVLVANTAAELVAKFRSDLNGAAGQPDLRRSEEQLLQLTGHHLCRRVGNPADFRRDINLMKTNSLPFDSDCIDERLGSTAFEVADGYATLDFNQLMGSSRSLTLPVVVQTREENAGEEVGCILSSSDDSVCARGEFNGANITYPDVFDTDPFGKWLLAGLGQLEDKLGLTGGNTVVTGLRLNNIRPSNEMEDGEEEESCQPAFLPRGIPLTGLACLTGRVPSLNNTQLYTVHSQYGMRVASEAVRQRPASVVYSDLASLGMQELAVFVGSKVESTWDSMARSLRETLLVGVMGHGLVSMPACGTHTATITNLHLLCLRWYQLAAFMPGIYSWYQDGDTRRQPYNLPKTYQRYLRWSMEQRYRLYPYFKSLYHDWAATARPLVRPLFIHYTEDRALGLWRQFLLGEDILVVPVLEATAELVNVTFPPGSWYGLGTGSKVSDQTMGTWKEERVTAALYEIPAYQRGGSTILAYETAEATLSETDSQSAFTLLVALSCPSIPRSSQKELSPCVATGTSYTNMPNTRLASRAVHSFSQGTGSLSLELEDKDYEYEYGSVRVLQSILVSGLPPFGELPYTLTITLPGNVTIQSTPTTGDQSAANAVYNSDKQVLLLRKLNIEMFNLENCENYICTLYWTFQPQ